MASPYIKHVRSLAEMTSLLNEVSTAVVDFHAAWSGPCRATTPFYSQLAAKHRTITFVKYEIDMDDVGSVGQNYRLTALPTFIMVRNKGEIDRIRGPDRKGLEDMIAKHALQDGPADSGSGYMDGIEANDSSLLEYIDMPQVNCLNESRDHTLKSIVEQKTRNTSEAYLESDADEQLLLTLPFNQVVKIRSLVLHTKDPKFGPKSIKIDINNPALGFDDMEGATEPAVVQVLEVSEDVVKEGGQIRLRFVRLQRVSSLHIFVGSNHGDEIVTRIDAIDIYGPSDGQPATTTQMSGLRNFLETHRRGMDLITLFQRAGGVGNLSNSVLLLREALLLCPTGNQDRAGILGNLTAALFIQYEQQGNYSDLVEIIPLHYQLLQLHPPGHPDRASSLGNLSNAHLTRYKREGSLADLSEATEHYQETLELHPLGHPDRARSLSNLSSALLTRYRHEGSLADLSEATGHYREALEHHPLGHPDRASSLGNLSNALLTRYKREGILADLSEATERCREAVELHPLGYPDRARSLSNLSDALLTRYQREGSLADLSEATERCREAVELHPLGHPDRATSLGNLSNTLLTQYGREGSLADLSEATERCREAVELHPLGHPDRARSLSNLSSALFTRYEREGILVDLSEATERYREALELRPLSHPDRAASLNNLSNALMARYQREGALADLSEATEHFREALELCPLGHLDRACSLSNLSNALLARNEHESSLTDLSEATERYKEVLELRPLGHPDRASSLNNLSHALMARYQREGSLADLSEATKQRREGLELRPIGHPARAQFLSLLSSVLMQTIDRASDAADGQGHRALVLEVLEVLCEAAGLPSCPPRDRLRAALWWINAARKLAPESTFDAYRAALDQLDVVLATSNTLENKHIQLGSSEELARCRQLGVEAASYAVSQGQLTLAVELLERGRNLLFAQVGRYRVELEELRKVNVELAYRFSKLSGLLDASVVSNQPTLGGRTAFEDPTERYRRVSADWNQAVDDIRNVEGFSNFLKAPDYATLQTAAAEGPIIIVIPSAEQSDALIISQHHDEPHHVILPEASWFEIAQLCNSLFQAMRADDERSTEKSMKKILGSLWDLVAGPIADALENKFYLAQHSRIWWCPTSLFSFLPLHAAGRYTGKDANQNLPDRYVSSYTPTLQALRRAQRNHSISGGMKMLIVAQPDTPGQAPLPNALEEAGIVEDVVGAGMETALICREGGTHTAILEGMAGHPWLHLICHGTQSSDNPFQSCFCLHDRKLTLQDIMRSGLPDARFAYLAACHTATGDVKLSDEGLHLAAGLQFSGFKGVVGTTWKVADEDGPLVAKAFYQALLEEGREEGGMDCSRAAYALNRAVKQLRADGAVKVNSLMRFIHIGI